MGQETLNQVVEGAVTEIEGEGLDESTGEETKGKPAEDTGNDAPPAEKAPDDFDGLPANKPVPYDRFKSVIEKRKEAEKRAKEFEEKYKDVDPERYRVMSTGTDKLIRAVQTQPWLDQLLSDLLDDRKPNWQAVFEAVKKVVPDPAQAAAATQALAAGKAPASSDDPRLSRIEEQQAQVLYRLQTAEYEKSVDRQLAEINQDKDLKALTKEDVDEVLKEGLLEHQLTGKEPDLVKIARSVQARIKAIEDRVLKSQVANAGKKKNAGGEKGGGVAGKENKKLNPNSPSFLKDVADMADDLAGEEG